MAQKPGITIITINYNNKAGLYKTIQSVLLQDYENIDYIIIDGGSNDGSKELLKVYEDKLYYSVSERDNGIYNAMNKGIKKAKGDYILFLNSGDYFKNKTVISALVNGGNNADIIYGDILLQDKNQLKEVIYPDKITFKFFLLNSLPHASALIRSSLFDIVGLYNETYKISSDWEFYLLALAKHNCSYKHVKIFVTIFGLEGISSNPENIQIIKNERDTSLHKYFPLVVDDYAEQEALEKEIVKIRNNTGYRIYHKLKRVFTFNN
jgi:glycosyltransferase involved in cell wall biosynthesis